MQNWRGERSEPLTRFNLDNLFGKLKVPFHQLRVFRERLKNMAKYTFTSEMDKEIQYAEMGTIPEGAEARCGAWKKRLLRTG